LGEGTPVVHHSQRAPLRFVLIGAGAVGGYLGGRLIQSGQAVTFLVRPARERQLDEEGLRIESPLGNTHLMVKAVADPTAIGACDVIVVAVKSFDLDSVLATIGWLGRDGARVVSVLNGVEHLDKISEAVGRRSIVGAPLQMEATLGQKGEIIHKSVAPRLILGSLVGMPEDAEHVLEAFAAAGLKATLSSNLLLDFWRKNLFITVFSSATTLARKPIGEVLANARTRQVAEEMAGELVRIACLAEPQAGSITEDEVMKRIRSMPPTMSSSMHHDLEKGLPLEVEGIQGYMVRKARKVGVKAPALEASYAALRLLNERPSRGKAAPTTVLDG